MTSFLINIDSAEKEITFRKLAKQLHIPLVKLSASQKEDIGLVYLMEKADRTKTVSRGKIFKKLQEKCK